MSPHRSDRRHHGWRWRHTRPWAPDRRPSVVIAFHSGYGHTAVLAEAVARGVASTSAEAVSFPVDAITDEQWARLGAADAIIFGSPTYMGTTSAAFHTFAEAGPRRRAVQSWAGKVVAEFTNSDDKSFTLGSFATLAAQHGMHWVDLGPLPSRGSTTGSENDLNRLGYFAGVGGRSPNDAGPEAVHKSDIATAEHLGTLVAREAQIFAAGHVARAA
ncbi:flavodoxin family protein [Streptomyces yokosukanensis]|uniref:flavodoxin family protein n=1 Tax=Streptomyces yokosukanensis TaxID=67386 RepID=UPI00341D9682